MIEEIPVRYDPYGAARELMKTRAPEVLLSGPAGTGKSRACLQKMHYAMMKYPNARALMIRQTQVSLTESGLVTYREHVAKEDIAIGAVTWFGGSEKEPAAWKYDNGSTIAVGGMDKPGKVMSTEYDMIYVQEAIELNITAWENLTTRLRNGVLPYQQLIADTNPAQPTHWLYRRVQDGRTVMLNSRHEDNPRLFGRNGKVTERGAAYLANLDNLTGVRYLRLRKGQWVAAEGLVYEEWDDARNVVDVLPEGIETWPLVWSVDFGYSNPFVLQAWRTDPDGGFLLEREIYRTGRLVEDHVRDVADWPRPEKIICDHDAEDRETFTRHYGMSTVPARKTVSDGVQACAVRIRPNGAGKARLRIYRHATVYRDPSLIARALPASTLEEVPGYVWPEAERIKAADKRENPVKENDHGMDAMRYRVADADLQPQGGFRWLEW